MQNSFKAVQKSAIAKVAAVSLASGGMSGCLVTPYPQYGYAYGAPVVTVAPACDYLISPYGRAWTCDPVGYGYGYGWIGGGYYAGGRLVGHRDGFTGHPPRSAPRPSGRSPTAHSAPAHHQ